MLALYTCVILFCCDSVLSWIARMRDSRSVWRDAKPDSCAFIPILPATSVQHNTEKELDDVRCLTIFKCNIFSIKSTTLHTLIQWHYTSKQQLLRYLWFDYLKILLKALAVLRRCLSVHLPCSGCAYWAPAEEGRSDFLSARILRRALSNTVHSSASRLVRRSQGWQITIRW